MVAEAALNEAASRFPLSYQPRVVWRGYRVTAGIAYYRTGIIGLSAFVLKSPEAVRETLLHEYAHLLAVDRHGPSAANHGPAWQRAMHDLGVSPTVKHTYDVERNVSRQRVTYVCVRCGTAIVRTRRLRKTHRYVHTDCGGSLRLQKVERLVR